MKRNLFLILAIFLFVSGAVAQTDIKTKIDANLMFAKNQIQRAIDEPKNNTSDDIQKLLFELEVWKVELAKVINATPAQFPANWASPVQDKIDELKEMKKK